MDSPPKLFRTSRARFLANFTSPYANYYALKGGSQQHTTHQLMEKLKEPTKYRQIIFATSSTTIRMIDASCNRYRLLV